MLHDIDAAHYRDISGRTSSYSWLRLEHGGVMKPRLVLGACALICWLSSASHGEIVIAEQYDTGEAIVVQVEATGIPDGAKLRGAVQVSGKASVWQPDSNKSEYAIWAEPGTHTITASGVWVLTAEVEFNGQKLQVLQDFGQYSYTKSFTVKGAVKPDPKPEPDPNPPQPGGPYQLVMFYQEEQLDNLPAEQRELLTSRVYWSELSAAGHLLLGVLPANAAPPQNSKFRAFYNAIQNDPTPRLAVASKDNGGPIVDMPLPATKAELNALLKTELIQ